MPVVLQRDSAFTLSPAVRGRQLDNELILLDLGKGEYFSLNESGAAVWACLERGMALGAIDEAMAGWPVAPDQRWEMITAIVLELRSRGLLEPAG